MRQDIRHEARRITRALDKSYVEDNSREITRRLFDFLEGKVDLTNSNTRVFVYNSYGNEVVTCDIISKLLDTNVKVYLPVVRGDIMETIRITHDTQYVIGAYGIEEPVGDKYDGDFDLSITPLLAYDRQLNRMGKGKGYYDRFFSCHNVELIVGLAFSYQEFESVFPQAHDIKMNAIINEGEVICE